MNLSNAKLILSREIRDQLRDRRTLFMIFVLPILLYPLLGMTFVQIRQFMLEKPVSVLIVGAKTLTDLNEGHPQQRVERDLPPLIENQRFSKALFSDSDEAKLLELHFARDEPREDVAEDVEKMLPPRFEARRAVQAGQYNAALYFPDDFADRLKDFRQMLEDRVDRGGRGPLPPEPEEVPSPEIIYTTANEKSQAASDRLSKVLGSWRQKVVKINLEAGGVPPSAARPFEFDESDVAEQTAYRGAALWSKILPVLLLLWAMTGAFYPAVDLCAGEKERGTLETLLSSPAERSEIVLGKLLTIMLFSMITAVLNLLSVGLTGYLVLRHMPQFGPPPPLAVVWLVIALVPISALFSALCLALAAFARSTKEGQYYLMPLLLITMPLAVLPMVPHVELSLGNSLIPVTGLVLLLRSVMEGAYWQALQFLPVVVAVTLAACLLAIRWAVDQFNSESVLFRESERLEVGLWLRHLVRDRQPTPTVAGAVCCGAMILLAKFFMSFVMDDRPGDFADFARTTIVIQLAVVAAPALLMTIVLTNSPRQTLLLKRPPWMAIPAAAALAVVLHPAVCAVGAAAEQLYPISEKMSPAFQRIQNLINGAPFWQAILVIAVTPAICEELAFRGFVLSGFRHLGHKWRAITYSALFFAMTHMILQQSLVVCVVGVVVGYLAVQSGSLLPGMIFHLIHNTLMVSISRVPPTVLDRWPALKMLILRAKEGYAYHWTTMVAGGLAALLILCWFRRLPYQKSPEEKLQEAIHRGLSRDQELRMIGGKPEPPLAALQQESRTRSAVPTPEP